MEINSNMFHYGDVIFRDVDVLLLLVFLMQLTNFYCSLHSTSGEVFSRCSSDKHSCIYIIILQLCNECNTFCEFHLPLSDKRAKHATTCVHLIS